MQDTEINITTPTLGAVEAFFQWKNMERTKANFCCM